MNSTRTDLEFAQELDARDELAPFRNEFVIDDPNLIYLDGNSLGRLPKRTVDHLHRAIEAEWGKRLIRIWNDGWLDTPTELGAKIAKLIGARSDEVLVTEATSINLFKLAVAALRARPKRTKIVSDVFNFPSDLYILQGIIDLMGNRHRLELVPSADTISIAPEAIRATIDEQTALVCLTHVAFKSDFLYDMATVTKQAHEAGAMMLWDLSHSVGAVPVDLNGANVDLAVGCTYKYLNGSPGAPAFLYVRRDLQDRLTQPLWGWFSAKNPFDFDLDYLPADDISRYRVGAPPMLSMKAIEPAIDILLKAGMGPLRAKSIEQTEYLIHLADQWLVPLGFTLGSPRQSENRGSHVSLRHADGWRISQAMIESEPPAVKVIPDFRPPDNIRLGIAPIYTTFSDIQRAMDRIRVITESRIYEQFSVGKTMVT
uniref:Kynureninase n=1 Tax=Candidatus Kentrum sp. SD TaxID=2126332 RepID=A0A451BNF4_9GAMM|nr:MAG: Kynureninase [Candidatus Kentron sp. SD]VFK48217.1 MAG: Kynureninase [Candidatus Kentron sp. SD]VFK79816.1 MAG: Kynureninase [Candidatus Kentron sp. SD]